MASLSELAKRAILSAVRDPDSAKVLIDLFEGSDVVSTSELNPLSVTTSKIADGNITTAKLADTGVTANTYGSASEVPVVTVNAKGQVTGVTTAAVAAGGGGVSGFSSPATGVFKFDGDPATSQANIFVGTSYGAGLVSGADGVSGEYGADLMLYGGQSPDSNGGNIIMSAGYNAGTNVQSNVYVGGKKIYMQGQMNLTAVTTTQRDAIFSSPQNGDFCLNSTVGALQFYLAGAWHTVTST